MVYTVGKFKRLRRGHAWNMPAEEINNLLIGVTVAIEDDYSGFKTGSAAGLNIFGDFRDRFWCRRHGHRGEILADMKERVNTCFAFVFPFKKDFPDRSWINKGRYPC